MTVDYETACRQHATAQGLDPIVDALREAGLPVEVEQTGGFCMVAVVTSGGRSYAVVRDAEDPAPWLLGIYTEQGWRDGDEPVEEHPDGLTTGQVLDLMPTTADNWLGRAQAAERGERPAEIVKLTGRRSVSSPGGDR